MKIFSRIIVFVFLLTVLATPANADIYRINTTYKYDTYEINEIGMTISIPKDYIVFTRDVSDYDPNLAKYGISKENLIEMMESGNIYLNILEKETNNEIVVTMVDSPLGDFNLYGDMFLNALADEFKSMYEGYGLNISNYEIYQHSQAKFIKMDFTQKNGESTVYGIEYYTVYDNMVITVTLHNYSGKISPSKKSSLNSIVDSIVFYADPLLPETKSETNSFVYNDTDSNIEFTVPANWVQKDLSQDRDMLSAKFVSNKEQGMTMLYGSTDLWEQMSSADKEGLSRTDIDNSFFTIGDLAEYVDIKDDNFSAVKYRGKEYYKFISTASSDVFGIELTIEYTTLVRIDNGYLYIFQFSGTDSNELYSDFEALVKSVKYPSVSEAQIATNITSSKNTGIGLTWYRSATNLVFSILITILIYTIPIVIYRYGIRKMPVEPKKARKITIIYAIIAFILMSVLISLINGSGAAGGAIIFWSFINYQILSGGKKSKPDENTQIGIPTVLHTEPACIENEKYHDETKPNAKSSIEQSEQEAEITIHCERKVLFCPQCGAPVESKKHLFCTECGTRLRDQK